MPYIYSGAAKHMGCGVGAELPDPVTWVVMVAELNAFDE